MESPESENQSRKLVGRSDPTSTEVRDRNYTSALISDPTDYSNRVTPHARAFDFLVNVPFSLSSGDNEHQVAAPAFIRFCHLSSTTTPFFY